MISFHNLIWYFKNLKCGICIAKLVKFSWKFKRLTFKNNFPVYHWLWFTFWWYIEFEIQCGVQLNENHKPTICGCYIRYFEPRKFAAIIGREAEKNAVKYWETLYPNYKGFIDAY